MTSTANNSRTTTTDTTTELSVPDFAQAKDFYSMLDFKVVWEEPPNKLNGYLVMKLDNSILCFFCGNDYVYEHPYFRQYPKTTKRGYGVEISIPAINIDKYYARVAKRIPEHVYQPLKLQPWGKKDFRIEDCFGYFLRFNEPWNVLEYLPLNSDYPILS